MRTHSFVVQCFSFLFVSFLTKTISQLTVVGQNGIYGQSVRNRVEQVANFALDLVQIPLHHMGAKSARDRD